MAKVGINGFGRKGKLLLRAIFDRQPTKLIPCLINDPAINSPKYGAYVFKHDSVHGRFYGDVCADDKHLIVRGTKIAVYKETDGKKVPWAQNNVEYIVECSGKNNTKDKAKQLVMGKVKKVVVTAPSPDTPMFVLGVNQNEYKPTEKVISMASCSTNAIAPLLKVVHEKFGIREAIFTVVHPVESFQKLTDGFSDKSYRFGRSGFNIIPESSEASDAIGRIIPDLKGKVGGMAVRVPLAASALVEVTIKTCKSAKLQDINDVIKDAAQCSMSGILCYTEEQVVSSDCIGCTCSSIYDASASMQLNDNLFKLIIWYDSEYGYACRLADLLAYIHKRDVEAECEEKNKKQARDEKPKPAGKPVQKAKI